MSLPLTLRISLTGDSEALSYQDTLTLNSCNAFKFGTSTPIYTMLAIVFLILISMPNVVDVKVQHL